MALEVELLLLVLVLHLLRVTCKSKSSCKH